MNVIEWLTTARRNTSELRQHIQKLITEADDQTCRQWEIINQSRHARGDAPIAPGHPFRPHELIDPCPGEDDE